jgi:hypothetical protein
MAVNSLAVWFAQVVWNHFTHDPHAPWWSMAMAIYGAGGGHVSLRSCGATRG